MATFADKELTQELIEAANQLADPPSSVDELLPLLDQIWKCLSNVEQSPGESMQKALNTTLKALVADKVFRHPDVDVKVFVASCISEITRITAPEAPSSDEQMKEVFQLIVSSFEFLSDKSSRSYDKRISILETVAKVRSCVVMLDLECDGMIVEMFRHFFTSIRDHHSESTFSSMEFIITLVLEESEEITVDLLSPILDSIKNNEKVQPVARKLGEKVLEKLSSKVKPCLIAAVRNLGISFDDYSKVLSSICQDQEISRAVQNNANDSDEQTAVGNHTVKTSMDAEQINEGIETEAPSMKCGEPTNDISSNPSGENGFLQAGDDADYVVSDHLQKEDDVEQTEHLKTAAEPTKNAACISEAEKVVSDNLGKEEDDVQQTGNIKTIDDPSRDTAGNSEAEKADNSMVHKQGQASKRKSRKPNSSFKLVEPSGSSQAAGVKEVEKFPDHECMNKDKLSEPSIDPPAEPVLSLKNETQDIEPHSQKVIENKVANVTPPSHSANLDDESRSTKTGGSNRDEECVSSATAVPKQTSEGDSDMDAKPQGSPVLMVHSSISNGDATPATLHVSKESGTKKISKTKPLKHVAGKVDEPSKFQDKVPPIQSKNKRKRSKSASKKRIAMDNELTEPHLIENSNTNTKRMCTPGKEKEPDIVESGANLIGKKVKIWWPLDKEYYEGVIDSFDPTKKRHMITYADGEIEILNLKDEKWEMVADYSDKEKGSDDGSPASSSDMPLNKKLKKISESSKQVKLEASDKRASSGSSSKTKGQGTGKKSDKKKHKSSKDDGKLRKEHESTVEDDDGKLKDYLPKGWSKSKKADRATPKSSKMETSKSKQEETPKKSKSKQITSSSSKGNSSGKIKSCSNVKRGAAENVKQDSSDKGKSSNTSKVSGKRRRQ